ncbi:MAG: hypothetical protein FWC27_10210 [Firmicutes bacterium]|nr:hypothetical protein [Bacillota bacterium]
MRKILFLLCLLVLAVSVLSACGEKPDTNGIPIDITVPGLYQRNFEFSATWPENEFTEQVPEPKFETSLSKPGETNFTVLCAASVDQLKEYVESLKQAGFINNDKTEEENAFGVIAYYYTATNEKGYSVDVNYSNTLGGMATLTIKKAT